MEGRGRENKDALPYLQIVALCVATQRGGSAMTVLLTSPPTSTSHSMWSTSVAAVVNWCTENPLNGLGTRSQRSHPILVASMS